MNTTRAYRVRLRRLLLDEEYGPRLARLNVADTARVLHLVEQNEGAQARREIIRLDEERRKRETDDRKRRLLAHTISHIITELVRVGTAEPVNSSTVALGVAVMTTGQRADTDAMDGHELKINAGVRTHIQWASPYGKHWNPWWYH